MSNVTVVKVGGALLEQPEAAVARITSQKYDRLIVVHGGGVQITRMLEKMNVKSEFIDGLRVTDEKALGAVAAALLGEVHTALVYALQRAGIPAIGMFGAVKAEKKEGPWGFVGTRVSADRSVLEPIERAETPWPTVEAWAQRLQREAPRQASAPYRRRGER